MSFKADLDAEGLRRESIRVGKLVQSSRARMRRTLTQAIIAVERVAKRNAKSGGVFGPRSEGPLSKSISHRVEESGDGAVALLTVGVPYGMIQEFGGKTRAHEIRAKNGGVLAWRASSGNPFASKRGRGRSAYGMVFVSGKQGSPGVVHHPGSVLRPKKYAALAFQDKMPFIESLLGGIITGDAG